MSSRCFAAFQRKVFLSKHETCEQSHDFITEHPNQPNSYCVIQEYNIKIALIRIDPYAGTLNVCFIFLNSKVKLAIVYPCLSFEKKTFR